MRTASSAAAVVALALALTGCHKDKKDAAPRGLGVRVADDGEVARVTGSPGGKWIAFLGQVERPKELGVPEGILVGTLELVPSDGARAARRLLGGVTNLEGAFAFNATGQMLAAIEGFRFGTQTGSLELLAVGQGGDPVHLADDCSSFLFSPDGRWLAWVSGSAAYLGRADGSGARKLAQGAATLEFSRDSKRLLVRKQAAAGAALLVAEVGSNAPGRQLAAHVGDYLFSPDGADVAFTTHSLDPRGGWDLAVVSSRGGAPQSVAAEVARFAYSPDGRHLAFIAGITPSKAFGDLWAVELASLQHASAGGGPRGSKLGDRVETFAFAPDSRGLAFLEHWDGNAHSGTLTVAPLPLGEAPRPLYRPAKNFAWSPDGAYLAYTVLVLRPAVSVDLNLLAMRDLHPGASLADGGVAWASGARTVAAGVFGYELVGSKALLYRTDCLMDGRACDLYAIPLSGPALAAKVAGGVWRFAVSRDGHRLLVTYPRVDSETVSDLGVLNFVGPGGSVGIDTLVEPGAQFLDPQGTRVAYGVIDRRRRGVYVAGVPLPVVEARSGGR